MRVGRPACMPYHARNVAEISLASVNLPSELRKVSARGVTAAYRLTDAGFLTCRGATSLIIGARKFGLT